MSPVYLAKYCSKRLPYSCSVIVIEEGKVAFQKEGAMKRQYGKERLYISLVSLTFCGYLSEANNLGEYL